MSNDSLVMSELNKRIMRTKNELEELREDFDRANSNDVYRQGTIAHNISVKVAELECLEKFYMRMKGLIE